MSERFHICLLTSARLFGISYGGEKKFTLSLGNWLAQKGQGVILIGSRFPGIESKSVTQSNRNSNELYGSENLTFSEHRKVKRSQPPYFLYLLSRLWIALLWFFKISSVDRKHPITIIHAQDTGYAGLTAILSGKFLRIPVIVSSHGIRHKTLEPVIRGMFKRAFLKINRRLDIFTVRKADRILVTNSAVKKYYERIVAPRVIDVIAMPIKLKEFEFSGTNRDRTRREIGVEENVRLIGFVGRLSPEKNLFTLLSSFANVAKHYPLTRLAIVGSGQLEDQLRDYVIEKGIEDKVTFCGVRYDMGVVLAGFDVFVLPSYTEGLSNALLEAMACGRAIICSNIDANREIVTHNEEALLVNPHSSKELQDAIQLLCTDNELRSKLGQNAKIKSRIYDEDIVFPKLLKYYENVLTTRTK